MTSFRSILLAAAATVAFSGAAMAGDNNYGSAAQYGGGNSSDILQAGSNNMATVYQHQDTNNSTYGNTSDVVMAGNGNTMQGGNTMQLVDNGGGNNPSMQWTNSVSSSYGVHQYGRDNVQSTLIRGNSNVGRVIQSGYRNTSTVRVDDGAYTTQGDGNLFTVAQAGGNDNTSSAGIYGNGNTVSTFQFGSTNTAAHLIDGSGNTSHISQY